MFDAPVLMPTQKRSTVGTCSTSARAPRWLIQGKHHTLGQRVDLKAITCPLLTIAADKDTNCPPKAAVALNAAVGSKQTQVLPVHGGHVGAVVGSKAADKLYPVLITWMKERTCSSRI